MFRRSCRSMIWTNSGRTSSQPRLRDGSPCLLRTRELLSFTPKPQQRVATTHDRPDRQVGVSHR